MLAIMCVCGVEGRLCVFVCLFVCLFLVLFLGGVVSVLNNRCLVFNLFCF